MIRERLPHPRPASEISPSLLRDLARSARPKQWIKNGFVFAALIFAGKLGDPVLVTKTVAGFFLFSALSSAVYLLNDAVDVEADRQHPLKASRPIAAGRVSVFTAVTLAVAVSIISLVLSTLLDYRFGLVALAYLALNVAYTFWLKHMVLVDVFAIAGGFVLRAMAGAAVIHVSIS
ncbi:MAG TPA: UbiA family prenyltransferase, partial [Chloroflexota bacterium]